MTIEPQPDADAEGDLASIFEALPVSVFTARPDGFILHANRPWREYVGPSTEIEGIRWTDRVHPEERGRRLAAWEESLRTGRPFDEQCRLRSGDGNYRWFLVRARPYRDAVASAAPWVAACVDVEAMKQVEETLRRSNEDLDHVASVAAHDLQEPLRKIQGFGERLAQRSGEALDDLGRDHLGRILGAAERMGGLIQDVLTLSRVSGQSRTFVDVNLREVVEGVVDDLGAAIEQTGAVVLIGQLPTIRADSGMIRRLLQNLIANSIKYHRPGTPPRVRVDGRAGETGEGGSSSWIIEVADDGIGFDAKHRDRIFQPFRRLHGRSQYDGSGLGLAICRRIVERHGGTIDANGVSGEGAVFQIVLPAASPDRGAAEADEADDGEGGGPCETSQSG